MDDYSELFKEFEPNTGESGEIETPEEPVSEIPLVNELKRGKYSYVPISELEWAYEKALHIYLSRVFALHYNVVDVPEDRPRDKTWVKRCMLEILAMNGIMEDVPLRMYSENGMKYEFDENGLSTELLKDLPPPMGAVRGTRKWK